MNPSIVLNVLLNLFFLLVLKMTVNGVALATVLSNVISSVLLFRKLLLTTQPVQVERKYFLFDLTVFKRILQIGLQSAVFAITNIAVQSAINSQCCFQSGNLRILYFQLVQSGLYHLCRTELRSRKHRTFETVMLAYPISLGLAAICIFFILMYYRPSKRFASSV